MRVAYALALGASLAALGCTGERKREVAVSDSQSPDLRLAPADTLAPAPLPEPAGSRRDSGAGEDRRTQVGARTLPMKPPAPTRTTRPRIHRPPRAHTTTPSPTTAPAPTEGYAPQAPGADTAAPPASQSAPPTSPAAADTNAVAASAPAPIAPARDTAAPPAIDSASRPSSEPSALPLPAAAPAAAAHALPIGTQFPVRLQDTINSLLNSEGQTVTGLVSGDVRGPDGLTVLPSGSTVYVYIARLRPARTRSAADGELQLRVDSIMVAGQSYAVRADVGQVPHELRGRGVTAGEVEKVGAGAAAGAVVGGVVTGKTKGAVIGGVVGAAGGAVVAAHTASRDVVVTPGTLLPVVLREPFARR